MTDLADFTLRSRSLGALPVLQHVLDRLGLDALIEQYVPHVDRRCRIRPATALGILLRNILLGRRPIYGLQEWAQPFLPSLLGLAPDQVDGLNDDRVGRALDRLFRFRRYLQDHDLPWEEVIRRPNAHGADHPEDVWRVVPAPNPSAEGYRIVWVWSQLMARQNEQSRASWPKGASPVGPRRK